MDNAYPCKIKTCRVSLLMAPALQGTASSIPIPPSGAREMLPMCKAGFALLAWAAGGAILGAGLGLGFGILFGSLEGLLRLDLWRVPLCGGYFALCGAAAGGIVGAYGGLTDGE